MLSLKYLIVIGLTFSFLSHKAWADSVAQETCVIPLESRIPRSVREVLKADLAFLMQIRGGSTSNLHNQIFGGSSISGASYCRYLQDRVTSIGYWPDEKALFSALYVVDQERMFVNLSYTATSRLNRLAALIHEASHKNSPSHVLCPTPFLDKNGKDIMSTLQPDVTLAGSDACDNDISGSYAIHAIWLKNIVNSCTNCAVDEEKDELNEAIARYSYRVLSPEARELLETDTSAQAGECGYKDVIIKNASSYDISATCAAISSLKTAFASLAIDIEPKVTVIYQDQVILPDTEVVVHGYFNNKTFELYMTHLDSKKEIEKNFILHEMGHMFVNTYMKDTSAQISSVWHEALAYTLELALAEPQLREEALAQYTNAKPYDRLEDISPMVYMFDPNRFAVRSYMTLEAKGGLSFIKEVMDLKVRAAINKVEVKNTTPAAH